AAAQVSRKLVDLDPELPERFRFSPEAQELFIEWLTCLEGKLRTDDIHPALIAHLSKYRKLMPVLALLFTLADRAAGLVHEDGVLPRHTRQAAAWCEYLEAHARRVYSCVVTPQMRSAQELAERIRNRKVGADGVFSCREVYMNGWSGLGTPDSVKL